MKRLRIRARRDMSRRAGFTLLEILVAVAVLGVALTSLLGLQARNVRLTAEAQQLTIAGMLASRLIADVQAGDFPAVGSEEGNFVGDENDVSSSFNHVFGGTLSDGMAWRRETSETGLESLRRVQVFVAAAEDEPPLVSFEVIVRDGGPP
jgi:prepilin-type N-terminal cleavage/methylation domain-containing protein